MESFSNFTSTLQLPHFIPIPPIYTVSAVLSLSLILIYFPKLDFLFTLILLAETLLSLSKKLKSKMLLINDMKLFAFYYLLLTVLSVFGFLLNFLYRIFPILFSVKFAALFYLSANMQLLDFMDALIINLDFSTFHKTKKNSPQNINNSLKEAQNIVNEKMKAVDEIKKERKDL